MALVAAGLAMNALGYSLVAFGGGAGGSPLLLAALLILALGVGTAEAISNDLILGSAPMVKSGAAAAVSDTGYEVAPCWAPRCWVQSLRPPTSTTCGSPQAPLLFGRYITATIGLVPMATAAVLAAVVLRKVPKAAG